jgi:hypothetical protein
MAEQQVTCPECGSPIPYGRLSCASCGALLASVVGQGRRSRRDAAPGSTRPVPEPEPEPESELAPQLERELVLEPEPEAALEPQPQAQPEHVPVPEPEPGPAAAFEPQRPSEPEPAPDAAPAPAPDPESELASASQPALPSRRPTSPILPDWTDPRPVGPVAADQPPAPPSILGAYVAPRSPFTASLAPRAPAATTATSSARAIRPTPAAASALAHGVAAVPAPRAVAPAAHALARAASRELPDWLVVGGSTLAIASFILPWATDGVIGSRGSGYTATWGLANPGHLLLIVAAAAVIALNVLPNRVPAWIRSVVAPLVVGAVFVGLAFAYLARPFGGGEGVTLALLGAVTTLVGGALGARAGRDGSDRPSV